MAARPWVTPQEIRDYTSSKEVAARTDAKLQTDISRAELKVIAKTHNKFTDDEYPIIPEGVALAVKLLAEAYAQNNENTGKKRLTGETFDDYSYTAEVSDIDTDALGIDDLLEEYVKPVSRGKTVMRMRKL